MAQSEQKDEPKRLESSPLMHRVLRQEDADQLYRIYPDLPRSHLDGCPSCGKNNGKGVDGTVTVNGVDYICNCHDQLQRHKHYLNAGIGATYQFLWLKEFEGDQNALEIVQHWIDALEENIEAGRGLFLWSEKNGTGKTYLSAMILKQSVMCGYSSYMTTFQSMLSATKRGWNDSEYDRWYRRKIESAQVLLIDDLGKEVVDNSTFNREFAKQTLDTMIRVRVQQGRSTFFTSNFDPKNLGGYYGAGVVSLLNECVYAVQLGGEDYRGHAKHSLKMKGQRRIY